MLGSTYGRPELATAVAVMQRRSIDQIAELLEMPAGRGWLRDGFDPQLFAVWLAGAAIGRVVAELDPDRVDFEEYDRMWLDAVRYMLFG